MHKVPKSANVIFKNWKKDSVFRIMAWLHYADLNEALAF